MTFQRVVFFLPLLLTACYSALAYQPAGKSSRRAFFEKVGMATAVTASAFLPVTSAHAALPACPKGSKNCIRTTWTPPSGTQKADIAQTLIAVLNEYPQAGQQGVDKGGWTIVKNDLAKSGTAAIEYKSGIGNFAKYFNGGKPFVDDLLLEITDGKVEVRSSSRVGESDFDVNKKRLQYLNYALQAKGWDAPDPKY